MGRNAKITIKNATGYQLTYVESNIIHGKFQKDKLPPSAIANGHTESFEVGNKTGALIGPEGTVTYAAKIIVKEVEVCINLVFYWNHPFSGATSVYSVSSVPVGFCNFSLKPEIPVGHDQDVVITVQLQNLLHAYDIANWMNYISGDSPLAALTIPGTHDSGALIGGAAYECQRMNIATQLEKGMRYLDIRCRLKDGKLHIFHGDNDMRISFQEVVNDCTQFLKLHPSETLILCIKQEGGDAIANQFETEIAASKNRWWLENRLPSLQEVRGKIVLLRRFGNSALGIDVSDNWKDDNASFWVNNGNIHVQDKYNVLDTESSIGNKWQDIQRALQEAKTQNPDKLYINLTNGSGGIMPVMLATGAGIVVGSTGINERLYTTIAEMDKGRLGIIAMDFPESPNELLIPYIIGMNQFQ